MRILPRLDVAAGVLVAVGMMPLALSAQTPSAPAPAPAQLSMDQAVALALAHNQSLIAQRLGIDESKADEITAALKPNYNLSFVVDALPVFSPSHFTGMTFQDAIEYAATLSYTFERGGKRSNRVTVAQDTTDQTAKTVRDAERQLTFQTESAFITMLLAKSTLEVAQQDLKDFSNEVEVNRQRVTAG